MLPAEIKFPSLNDGDLLAFPTELPQHEAPCSQLLRGEKGGALQWRCYIACAYHCSRCVARTSTDREREFNTCWEQSMMGGVSEVTVSIDGRMEPARTRGDGSPMLPQSHEHSDQDLQIMVLVVREQARQEDRESKLCPFPFLLPSPERGRRTSCDAGQEEHSTGNGEKGAPKNLPIFCPTYRSKLG